MTICTFTTGPTIAPLFRLAVEPSEGNGLQSPSRLTVDKITTAPKSTFGRQIGRLGAEDVQAIVVFLGLASSPRAARG